ncbi:MAG: hypothetical protein ACYTFW_26660 [Planctomycetota bacterium]|jgi:hypothetical protein
MAPNKSQGRDSKLIGLNIKVNPNPSESYLTTPQLLIGRIFGVLTGWDNLSYYIVDLASLSEIHSRKLRKLKRNKVSRILIRHRHVGYEMERLLEPSFNEYLSIQIYSALNDSAFSQVPLKQNDFYYFGIGRVELVK